MALIKCTECGKEFSDKAPACPNCACPTEEVRKEIARNESERKKDWWKRAREEYCEEVGCGGIYIEEFEHEEYRRLHEVDYEANRFLDRIERGDYD